MSDILSCIVNAEGDVINFQDKKVKNAPKFFVEDGALRFAIRNIPEVSNYSSILRYMNDNLGLMYKINNERISLTEKNKGGDFTSSSFTVTTNLEKIKECESKELEIEKVFTIKKSSQFLLKCLLEAGKDSTYFDIERMDKIKDKEKFPKISEKAIEDAGGYKQALFLLSEKDIALNDCQEFPNGWFWIIFNAFKVELKKDKWELSDTHKIRYLSYMTKYIEIVSNTSSTNKYDTNEKKLLIQKYELFLFEILEAYFNITNVKLSS